MDSIDLIERTIVALQAGTPLPPDVAQEWERGLRNYRDTPGASLDKVMGFKSRRGKRGFWYQQAQRKRMRILDEHCRRYHKGKSKYEISRLIAEALEAQQSDYRVRNGEGSAEHAVVPSCYAILHEQLDALPLDIPRQAQLYRLLKRLS